MQNTAVTNQQVVQIELMNLINNLHHEKKHHKDEEKNKRKNAARRAIEIHNEKMQLKLAIREWWEDI